MPEELCSVLAADEPLAGTAPFALAWLVVEHPGPWGRDALTESGLSRAFVECMAAVQDAHPVRFLAARRIGHDRRSTVESGARTVWLAYGDASGGRVRRTIVDRLEETMEWDLEALSRGEVPEVGEPQLDPIEFVCTHSKRDTCCALLGREHVASVPPHQRDYVWECSHLGGHRFAATSLFLPSARVYGRLPVRSTGASHPEEPHPRHLRGASYLPAPLQAAECEVRVHAGLTAHDLVTVTQVSADDSTVVADVTAGDSVWTVECTAHTFNAPASCGADPTTRHAWRASVLSDGA